MFTLLAERYERGSVLLTSNLPFSKWEEIFKDAMTTAAAIDRLVHHCLILELNIPSYRMEQAKKNRESAWSPGKPTDHCAFNNKNAAAEGCGKSRAVESEENQKQVFLPSHRPWKSRTTRAIPTFPTAPTAAGISQTKSGILIVVDRKECLTPDSGCAERGKSLRAM